MTLNDRITQDIGDAMKARDQTRLSALRMAKAALMNAAVAKGRDLDDAESGQVLGSLLKQRRDSIEQFAAAGRTDLVEKERAELGILEAYAPPAVDEAELSAAVDAAIGETG
ncbi:MAG TPA: GatB/YqeY domain-containing protein, partial [Vicinamibacterales bacterium]|nr:GatB/YqeY domain-containing protein [Vicinamibacterales bacterium]